MDHAQFKDRQTAAIYVAEGLDERAQEAFELHMMDCAECLQDVEAWRAIKHSMPRKTAPALAPAAVRSGYAIQGWRMAASIIAGGILGAAGGWFGRTAVTPDIDSNQTAFFNLPTATRGADECTPLRYAADTQYAVLRVSGVSRDRRVIASDSNKHELAASRYNTRRQSDGSHLVRIRTPALDGLPVYLEAKAADGFSEPVGCIIGEIIQGK